MGKPHQRLQLSAVSVELVRTRESVERVRRESPSLGDDAPASFTPSALTRTGEKKACGTLEVTAGQPWQTSEIDSRAFANSRDAGLSVATCASRSTGHVTHMTSNSLTAPATYYCFTAADYCSLRTVVSQQACLAFLSDELQLSIQRVDLNSLRDRRHSTSAIPMFFRTGPVRFLERLHRNFATFTHAARAPFAFNMPRLSMNAMI